MECSTKIIKNVTRMPENGDFGFRKNALVKLRLFSWEIFKGQLSQNSKMTFVEE